MYSRGNTEMKLLLLLLLLKSWGGPYDKEYGKGVCSIFCIHLLLLILNNILQPKVMHGTFCHV